MCRSPTTRDSKASMKLCKELRHAVVRAPPHQEHTEPQVEQAEQVEESERTLRRVGGRRGRDQTSRDVGEPAGPRSPLEQVVSDPTKPMPEGRNQAQKEPQHDGRRVDEEEREHRRFQSRRRVRSVGLQVRSRRPGPITIISVSAAQMHQVAPRRALCPLVAMRGRVPASLPGGAPTFVRCGGTPWNLLVLVRIPACRHDRVTGPLADSVGSRIEGSRRGERRGPGGSDGSPNGSHHGRRRRRT